MNNSDIQPDLKKPFIRGEFLEFYKKNIEPRFDRFIDKDFFIEYMTSFRNEINDRFDYFVKKYEDLHQEYIVINYQLKRIDQRLETLEKGYAKQKEDIVEIKQRLSALESQGVEIGRKLEELKQSGEQVGRQWLHLEAEVYHLKVEVQDLQQRMNELEKPIRK